MFFFFVVKTRNPTAVYLLHIGHVFRPFCELAIVPWGCMGIDTVTCGDLKNLYNNQSCCGQALKHVSLCGEGTVWNGRQCIGIFFLFSDE